jgi:hypothetical protein
MNNRKTGSRKSYDVIDRSAEKFKFVHMQCESLMVRKRMPPSVRFDE